MAARQLTLLPVQPNGRLDDLTKERGRRGIARARAALAAHKPTDTNPVTTTITQAKGA